MSTSSVPVYDADDMYCKDITMPNIIDCDSNDPDDWWGGMNRSKYWLKHENKPLCVHEEAKNVVYGRHTGLVFVLNNNGPIRADLYVNGELLDTVIEYKTDENTKDIRRYEGGKDDKKKNGPFVFLPTQRFCFGRRERDMHREEREFIEGCWLSVIRDPWLLTFFIITILLLACFVFLLCFDLPYSEVFSIICLLFSLVLSVVFFMSKKWQIPIIVFYMITLLIGHYYSVNSLWAVFKYLFWIQVVVGLLIMDPVYLLTAKSDLLKYIAFVTPFLL